AAVAGSVEHDAVAGRDPVPVPVVVQPGQRHDAGRRRHGRSLGELIGMCLLELPPTPGDHVELTGARALVVLPFTSALARPEAESEVLLFPAPDDAARSRDHRALPLSTIAAASISAPSRTPGPRSSMTRSGLRLRRISSRSFLADGCVTKLRETSAPT